MQQNPWWRDKAELKKDEKIIDAFNKKHKHLFQFKEKRNILWIGPRQVGKTTFFQLLIYDLIFNKKVDSKKVCYYSCELIRDFREIPELLRKISLISNAKYIFLDEISFVENWHKAIKFILDSGIAKDKVLYLTGSSSLELRKEKFPGRDIETKNFLPLSFREFIKIFGSKKIRNIQPITLTDIKELLKGAKSIIPFKEELDYLLLKYTKCGGFPRAFYELMEKGRIREETYEIYWNWIINDIAKIERSEKIAIGVFEGIIKNYATKFSLNSIAKEVEIGSHVTVREYLEILENLFLIRNFYTYSLDKKRVVFRKMRKTYFIDPFILHAVNFKLRGEPFKDYAMIVEGLIAETLARKFNSLNIGFYHGYKEIDVCFKDFGIEVKWQENVDERNFPRINVKNKILISKNEFKYNKEKNLLIIPASIFLSLV